MKIHIGTKHFYPDLEKLMNPDEKWACLTCPKVCLSKTSIVYHLLHTHKAIAEHILEKDLLQHPDKNPKGEMDFKHSERSTASKKANDRPLRNASTLNVKYRESDEDEWTPEKSKNESKSISSKTESIRKSKNESKLNSSKTESIRKSKNEISKTEVDIHCSLCDVKSSNKRNLKRHTATIHYKELLLEKFGNVENKCGDCGNRFEKKSGFLAHIANSHDALNWLSAFEISQPQNVKV